MSARLYVAIGIMAILVVLWVAAYSWTTEETFEQQENDDKFLIYASFFPYYEFTKNIVGEKAEIVQFIPSGSQTHEWAPSIKKIQALTDTDVFVYNGLGMEPYVQEIIDSDEFNNIVFIKASKEIDLIKIDNEHVHDNDFKFDPHIWLDPLLVKDQVNNIMAGIILADPENTQYYKKNTIAYNMQLDELHEKIKLSLSTCNKDTIITYHDAFAYFAERYGLKVKSLGGLDHEQEFSSSKLAEFIEYAKDKDVDVIFAEDMMDSRLADVIAEEMEGRVLFFNPLETITKQEASDGITFINKMEDNLAVLEDALQCQ